MPPKTEFEKCAMQVLRLQNLHLQAKVNLRLARINQLAQLGQDRLTKRDELNQQTHKDLLEEQLAQLERDFLVKRDAVILSFQQAKEKLIEEHEAELRTLDATCLNSGFKLSDLHASLYCFWD